jgi:AraC-like DNA-binding protein
MVDCLDFRQRRESSLAQEQHAIVMRRFRRVVEEYPEEPLYIPEICKAIRVPDRTLRLCCQEHLGMGPKRYLLLRRMHLVRRALRQAATDETSVTDIATRYGFWHLGRFAVEYHSLFGESPSAHFAGNLHSDCTYLPKLDSRTKYRPPRVESRGGSARPPSTLSETVP